MLRGIKWVPQFKFVKDKILEDIFCKRQFFQKITEEKTSGDRNCRNKQKLGKWGQRNLGEAKLKGYNNQYMDYVYRISTRR